MSKPEPRREKNVPWCTEECCHSTIESDESIYCELASSRTAYKTRGDVCTPQVQIDETELALQRDQITAAQDQVQTEREENARLQAIVEKLPKTADGVPVTPDMPVFHPEWLHQKGQYGYLWVDYDTLEAVSRYKDFGRPVFQCFSTREAAEAARADK